MNVMSTKRHRPRFTFVSRRLSLVVALCGTVFGCSRQELTERSATEILEQDNVQTIRDFFQRASESLADGQEKKWLGDIDARVTEFRTAEEYFDQQRRDAAATSEFENDVEKVLERFAEVVHWKTKARDLKSIHRVYSVIVKVPFTKMMRNVDSLTRVELYTDNDGRILGWRQPFRDIVFRE